MDLFTRYRTILVMFVFISFVSSLVIRYFYKSARIDNPYKEEFSEYKPGPKYVLENSINIPIWKDKHSSGGFYNLRDRKNIRNGTKLVKWRDLIQNAKYIGKNLSIKKISFSFWINFDVTTILHPKTSIIEISSPTIIPFAVYALKNNPILEISYATTQNQTIASNSVSNGNDSYGGNQIGYNHTPTFVFITIEHDNIRLIINGIEQNYTANGIILEPDDTYIIRSGVTPTNRHRRTDGIFIKDLRIYAETVELSSVKHVYEEEKNKINNPNPPINPFSFFESFVTTEGFTTTILPDVKVGMNNLQMQSMTQKCNQGGTHYLTRNTYTVDKIEMTNKDGVTSDVTSILAPLLVPSSESSQVKQSVIEHLFNPNSRQKKVFTGGWVERSVEGFGLRNRLKTIRQQVQQKILANNQIAKKMRIIKERATKTITIATFELTIYQTNDHKIIQTPYKKRFNSTIDKIERYWSWVRNSILSRNTTNLTNACPATQDCVFFTAGKQDGKCVAKKTGNRVLRKVFDILKTGYSDPQKRTVDFYWLNRLSYDHFTFSHTLGNSGTGSTISFWFVASSKNFENDTFKNDSFYLLHCGDKTWDTTLNDISISVNYSGDMIFLLKDEEQTIHSETIPLRVLGSKPKHIAWVIDNDGNWSIYYNKIKVETKTIARPPIKRREFNMIGGTPNFERSGYDIPFMGVSIGEFKIFDYTLDSMQIENLYENK